MDIDYLEVTPNEEEEESYTLPEVDVTKFIPVQFHDRLYLFQKSAANRFPLSRKWDHAIETTDDFKPRKFNPYRLSPKEERAMHEFINENLEKGYIRSSKSPQAVPMFFVGKKDGGLRPCQDYRYLNKHTIPNAYPLPRIEEMFDALQGAKYFTTLNLNMTYHQV